MVVVIMAQYVSLRIQAVTHSKAAHQVAHDTRKRPPSYLRRFPYQVTFLPGTSERISDPDHAHERVRALLGATAERIKAKYREAVGQKYQGNGRAFIRGVLTFSPEAFDREDFPLSRWASLCLKTARDAAARLGVDLLAVTFHLDEKTPHAHFVMTNQGADGRSVMRKTKPADMSALQDLAGQVMSPLGFVRGVPRTVTGARHLSVVESHRVEREKAERARSAALDDLRETIREVKELRARVDDLKQERTRLIESGLAVQDDYRELSRMRKEEAVKLKAARRALMGVEGLPDLLRELGDMAGIPEIGAVLDAWGGSGPIPGAVLWGCLDAMEGPGR